MANYYTDHPEFDFYLNHPEMKRVVELKERNFEDKDKKNKYVRCERSYGTYARSFDISGIDAKAIKAAYSDGVLRVTLPKQKEVPASSRRLEIE